MISKTEKGIKNQVLSFKIKRTTALLMRGQTTVLSLQKGKKSAILWLYMENDMTKQQSQQAKPDNDFAGNCGRFGSFTREGIIGLISYDYCVLSIG